MLGMTVISLIFSWLFLEIKNMKMKFSKTYVAVVCLCIASSQSNLNVSSYENWKISGKKLQFTCSCRSNYATEPNVNSTRETVFS